MGQGLAYWLYMNEAENTGLLEERKIYVRADFNMGFAGNEETHYFEFDEGVMPSEIENFVEDMYNQYVRTYVDDNYEDYADEPDEAYDIFWNRGGWGWEQISKEEFHGM